MKEVRRYFSYLGKYKRRYCVILAITVIVSAMLEILYARMYQAVFGAAERGDHVLFVRGAALCVITVILYCLFPWLRYFEIHVVRKVVFEIKLRLFRKLLRMNMRYYESHHSGEGLKILNWDANSLKDSYFSHVYWVIGVSADGVAAMIAMFMYTPFLTIISMMFCAVTVWLSLWINREIKRQNRKLQESLTELTKRLSDILSGFVLLKMYRGAFLVTEHYRQENERVTRDEKKRVQKAALLDMLSFLMGILAGFGTMVVGILLVSTGKLGYGTVMAVVSLQIGVSEMMQRLGFSLNTFSASLVKAERVFNFLEMEGEEGNIDNVPERKNEPLELQPAIPLLIEKLDFAYDGERKVLDHFTLRVEEGDKILLSGESGCGKSTLLKLLLRFYDGSVGKICLFGREICSYPLRDLRDMLIYLPQNNYLMEGTVRENIALGRNGGVGISEEEIRRAARMAYAEEFVEKLPDGYDTIVRSGGRNLSGGQRQRIAIARAFLKDAPILLMDEPSSALDIQSEKMVHKALEKLTAQKVVIMVSHQGKSQKGGGWREVRMRIC